MKRTLQAFLFTLFFLGLSSVAISSPGDVDGSGCHTDSGGVYHCH